MSVHVLDSKPTTDDAFGTVPDERTLEQRLASGFILVDKPAGPTSHQLAAWARDLLGLDRLGHGGTLDPFATGVLPLMAGRCMKITNKILKHKKTYIAVFRFRTMPDEADLKKTIASMTGRIYNVPPEVSAVKVQVRTRTIHAFELLDVEGNDAVARISCDAGTYIRTMARDMGLLLNTPVTLKELRRETSGMFDLKDCVTMDQLADAVWLWKECGQEEALKAIVHPIEKLLVDVPRCQVKDSAVAALAYGAPLLLPGLISIPKGLKKGTELMVASLKEEAVGFVKLKADSNDIIAMETGEIARPSMVLMDTDVYPRRWPTSS
ncbi:MAG: RNA-guided pseudouridylation complex pseudouridine synthase subunit Cbf5 [Euryarchaeota archaeon]|nr:RNA-guided pseudouridylation complex pseudouridine synthase subunit Cbf5 [Euryarchaeota archaeon]